MLNDKVITLKGKQDALDSRREKLLAQFVPFREQLIRELELFIESAVNSDLKSVSKLRRVKDQKELKEIEFRLNTMELVLISNNNVLFQDVMTEDLAGKIFVYESGDENQTPLFEITLREYRKDEYRIHAQWFSSDGPRVIDDIGVSEEAGNKMVSNLVNHFYRFQFSWKDKPTMKAALGTGAKGSLGFLKE